jgi:hypothetical protein
MGWVCTRDRRRTCLWGNPPIRSCWRRALCTPERRTGSRGSSPGSCSRRRTADRRSRPSQPRTLHPSCIRWAARIRTSCSRCGLLFAETSRAVRISPDRLPARDSQCSSQRRTPCRSDIAHETDTRVHTCRLRSSRSRPCAPAFRADIRYIRLCRRRRTGPSGSPHLPYSRPAWNTSSARLARRRRLWGPRQGDNATGAPRTYRTQARV